MSVPAPEPAPAPAPVGLLPAEKAMLTTAFALDIGAYGAYRRYAEAVAIRHNWSADVLNKDFCDGQIYKDMFEVLETQNRAFVEKKNGTQATGYETWTVAMINKKAKDYAYSTCKRIQSHYKSLCDGHILNEKMKAEVLAGAAPDLKSAFENHYKLVEEADKIKRKADRAAAVLEKEARKEMDLDPEVEAFLVAKQEAGAKRYKSAAAGGGGAAGAGGGGGDEPEDDGDIEDDLAALRMEEAQVASGAGCGGGDEDADEPTIVDKVIAIIKDKMSERDVLRMALTLGWRPSINTTPTTGSRVDHVKTLIRNVLASADINKESGREHIRTLIGTLDALSLFKMLEAALA